MSSGREDEDLERRAREAFDASVAGLGAATQSRLRQARMRALQASAWNSPRLACVRRYAWMPATVVAALLAVWVLRGPDEAAQPELAASVTDLDILLAEEDLDVFEELEFYTWLEEQPELETPESAGDGVG